jgi:hypothetical protein
VGDFMTFQEISYFDQVVDEIVPFKSPTPYGVGKRFVLFGLMEFDRSAVLGSGNSIIKSLNH